MFHSFAHDEMLGGRYWLLHQASMKWMDVKGAWMDLPHIQGSVFLQALLQLSLAVSLWFRHFSTNQFFSNQAMLSCAPVPVCVCRSRNCTFLEIKLRAWAYLTSILLVLAASSLRMEYMADIASRPDCWRSSEYNEYLDICISRSASSTSLWATVSENLSLAKAWNRQAASCLKRHFHMVLWRENSQVTYNRNTEYAQKCPDSCVGGWCIWLASSWRMLEYAVAMYSSSSLGTEGMLCEWTDKNCRLASIR